MFNDPRFTDYLTALEDDRGLPRGVLKSLAIQESGGRSDAVGPETRYGRAKGMFQFIDDTAKRYNVDVTNPLDSARGAADHLTDDLKRYGSIEAALAAYNGGQGQAKLVAAGQQPTFIETAKYVPQVMARMQQAPQQPASKQAEPPPLATSPKSTQILQNTMAAGDPDSKVIAMLRQAGMTEAVDFARERGYTDREIIERLAPDAASTGYKAAADAESDGFLGRMGKSAKSAIEGTVLGGMQAAAQLTGDDQRHKALQEIEVDRRNDADEIARGATVAGKVGNVVGFAPLALIPGAGSVAGAAAIGAAQQALQPTVQGESRLSNAVVGAALGGGGALVARGAGSLWKTGGQAVDDIRGGNTLEAPQNQTLLARNLTSKAGVEGDVIDSAYIAGAKPVLGSRLQQAMSGVELDAADDVLKGIAAAARDTRIPGVLRRDVLKVFFDNNGPRATPIKVSELDGIKRGLDKDLVNPSLYASQREALSSLSTKIDEAMKKAFESSAEKQALFQQTKDQYRHLKALENVVAGTNDTGVVTTSALTSAIKKGRFKNSFVKGEAPYQDVVKALQSVEAEKHPAGMLMQMVESVIKGPVGSLMKVSPTLRMSTGAAKKLLGSKEPSVRDALMKLSPAQRAEIQAAAGEQFMDLPIG